jgi:glutathione synthase/RimK-type ligase-like ATP-grasp enzyme
LKPSVGQNSEGIVLIKTPDELAAWKQSAGDDRREYIAQKYIPGSDIDCSLLSQDGEIVVHTVQRHASAESGALVLALGAGRSVAVAGQSRGVVAPRDPKLMRRFAQT